MRVLFFSPAFPAEMPQFVRGLARVGAEPIGLGEHAEHELPAAVREVLVGYIRVNSLFDESEVIAQVLDAQDVGRIECVECLWEPGMILAARLREALGLPGMTVAQTVLFRDKEEMKRVLDLAGIRTPRHHRASTKREVREATDQLGFPLIIKPIAGAGSADTYRVDDKGALEAVLPRLGHVAAVSVEEFIEGEEYTYDTVCADGEVLYENISWYRPRPLIARSVEWISPQTIALRDIDRRDLAGGRAMGRAVLDKLGFATGFTHMEWFLTAGGEAVFGEIGARPAGARSVDIMNFASDVDLFTGWAEAICHGRLGQTVERRYNAAIVFKRASGQGTIWRITGLERLLGEFASSVVCVDLLPPGSRRRNWLETLVSDGYLIVRSPDLMRTLEMADRVGTDLQLHASEDEN